MKRNRKHLNLVLAVFLMAFAVVLMLFLAAASPALCKDNREQPKKSEAATLSVSDCIKCHQKECLDIATNGGAHKSEITCLDCHNGHPPKVKNNIPECSECHSGKAHFELKGCLNCHKNPHTPLNITFPKKVSKPCLTCHEEEGKKVATHKSAHTKVGCSTCHTKHGLIPRCAQCHKPHRPGQTQQDCTSCHDVHMPLQVTYNEKQPSKNCGACHKKIFAMLSANKSKHHKLTCAKCHKNRHKMIPKCQDCHGVPHPKSMLAKFPSCEACHNNPHDLNNWSGMTKK